MAANGGVGGPVQADLLRQLRTQAAAQAAGLLNFGEDVLGNPQRIHGLPIPIAGGGIEHHGGGGMSVFRAHLAGQEIAQQVRQQQQLIGNLQGHIAFPDPGMELVDGVEGHGADAGAAVQGGEIHHRVGGGHILVGGTTIRPGISQQMTVLVQQAVVHTPGVDAHAVQITDAQALEGQQALLHLAEQIGQIPIEHAVHFDIVVFKAVQLLHHDLIAVKGTQNGAAIAGAQIKCQKMIDPFHGVPS